MTSVSNEELLTQLEDLRIHGYYKRGLKLLEQHHPDRTTAMEIEEQRLLFYVLLEEESKIVDQYEYMVDCASNPANVLADYALYLYSIGEEGKALRMAEAAVVREPDNAHAHYAVAQLHYENEKLDLALAHAETASRLDKQYSSIAGQVAQEDKQATLATQYYLQALEHNIKDKNSVQECMTLLAKTDRVYETMELYKKILPHYQDDLDIARLFGQFIDKHFAAQPHEQDTGSLFDDALIDSYQYYYMKSGWRAHLKIVSAISLGMAILMVLTTVFSVVELSFDSTTYLLTYISSSVFLATVLTLREASRLVKKKLEFTRPLPSAAVVD